MIDIFYKTYYKDFKLLEYSLRSIKKFVTGYNEIVILMSEKDIHLFNADNLPDRCVIVGVSEYGDGYLYQQYCKMTAHNYCSAKFILFADSDCIFDHPLNLQEVIQDDKPVILHTDYGKVGEAICWKKPTEIFMHDHVDFEFMRRNTLIYHRSTLESICVYNPNLEYHIMKSGIFSEFNAIGAWAYKNERNKYNFINTDNWEYTPPLATQLWSHGAMDGNETHEREYKRSLEVINKIFDLNINEI